MVIAAATSIPLGSSHCHLCHAEGIGCSTSYVVSSSSGKYPFARHRFSDHSGISSRCKNPLTGVAKLHWLPVGREIWLSEVAVTADYPDSVPDSSVIARTNGYHPLEELNVRKRVHDTKLTPSEIARTTAQANSRALLVFPSMVHCEPHEQISWAEFQYAIDDYGDIFFEIFDDENILRDREASNLVNVLIGMDIPTYGSRRVAATKRDNSDIGASDYVPFNDEYFDIVDTEMADIPGDRGVPTDNSSDVHPLYFAKCLTKAVNMEYAKKMDHPSNGISIVGCLVPAYTDERSYFRRLFNGEDIDGYNSDWDVGEDWNSSIKGDEKCTGSTLYRLEVMRIKLFSVYGAQSLIGVQDFQEAEPDVLVHSTSTIIERFGEKGTRCQSALKAFCKKKGLCVEGAKLIGVDSLGMDVRVYSGVEVETHRFPFNVRATSEGAAEKQIKRLLFPRAQRKKHRTHGDGDEDEDTF